ncbi:MAG: haloacid dehalogenase-like hydrolase, partial [Geminicoccaceae bacterium]
MIARRAKHIAAAAVLTLLAACSTTESLIQPADPLPSWNDGATKEAITTFVEAVTTEGGPDYVAPADRIA